MPGPQHGSAHSERKVQAPTHKTGHWKGQGWDWLHTLQGKTSPFSHCHAAEGLLPSAGGWDGVEAIVSASPRGVVIPTGTGWDGAGRQELGEHWDGANTGDGCQRCRCTSTSRTALYRASSAQPWDILSTGYKMLLVSRRLCLPSLPDISLFWESPQVPAWQTSSCALWLSSIPT